MTHPVDPRPWPQGPGSPMGPGLGAVPPLPPVRRGASAVSRLLSVLVAVVATVAGGLLFWWAGYEQLLAENASFGGHTSGGALRAAFMVLGVLLVLVAGATCALSGLGAVVLGAVFTLGGLIGLLAPAGAVGFGPGVFMPLVVRSYGGGGGSFTQSYQMGVMSFVLSGAAIVAGVILLLTGLLGRGRRRPAPVLGVALGAVLGCLVMLTVPLLLLVVSGQLYVNTLQYFGRGTALQAIGVTVLALLLGACALTARWTSIPLVVFGVISLAVGLWSSVSPYGLLAGLSRIGLPAERWVWLQPPLMEQFAIVGALALGAGLGVWARTLRRPRG